MATQPDAPTALPADLDFTADPAATPDRMNRAMIYLLGQVRIAQAQVKSYQTVIDELRALGLSRVADALTPVFQQAQDTGAQIQAIYDGLAANGALEDYYTREEADALLALLAPLHDPAFSGEPTAPTAAPGTDSTRIATTEFVLAAIAALVDAAPGQLNTLNELAAALGDDGDFAATVTAALAAKAALIGPQVLEQTQIKPEVDTAASEASPWAWNSDGKDALERTAQAANLTLSADAGTPVNCQKRLLRIAASGADRTITFTGGTANGFLDATQGWLTVSGANWTYVIPAGMTADFGLIYDATAQRWRIVGLSQG